MSENYRLLLKAAALLYEKHEAGRPEPFNVFSVLRSASDEVNLHSRFLHALLNYKKPAGENRENLTDFLRHVGVEDFEQRGIRVERERDNIDILITNDDKQAVVVENKIWAGDQPEQLRRYHATLTERGYGRIHLLYLTLDGHDPSEDSAGGLPYETISYRDTLPPWLEGCQQRADDLGLRASVTQYLQLVRKLTGTDLKGAYMNELKDLCLEGNNLVLVHDLNEAMLEAKVSLLHQLWCDIDAVLKEEISELPPRTDDSDISEETIKKFLTSGRIVYHGLYYSHDDQVFLSVSTEEASVNYLIFGFFCEEGMYPDKHNKLRKILDQVGGSRRTTTGSPWYQPADEDMNLKYPTRQVLDQLSNEVGRRRYAKKIAQVLKPLWEAVKEAGLAGQNP